MRRLPWIGLGIVVVGIAVLVVADIFTNFGEFRGYQIVTLVAATAWLSVLGGGVLGSYRGQGSMALRHFAIWLSIIAVLALIYNYREALGFNF